jgi:predicted glycosyltransferase
LNDHNKAIIKRSNRHGFTVNVSTESKSDAVSAYNQGLPAVVVVPSDHADTAEHEGVKFVTCPAQTNDTMTCSKCGLCSQSKRQCVVMFKAHGNAKRHVSELVG